MKVWDRCNDCGLWGEDCTCVCGFVPEQEEKFIQSDPRLHERRRLERLELHYLAHYCKGRDCHICLSDPWWHGWEDCYSDGWAPCTACGSYDCSGAGSQRDWYWYDEDYYCDWAEWADELAEQRNEPLRKLANALGGLWQA